MKQGFYIVIAFLFLAFSANKIVKRSFAVSIKNDSEVSISGTTNVNSFNCCYNIARLESPIPVSFESNENTMLFSSTVLELENKCFDCGHKGINKDFNELLKTELYPKIKLQLIKIEKTQKFENTYNAEVKIFIANTSRVYTAPVSVSKERDYKVAGELNLSLKDFNLEAPKKIMGLIVVYDEIKVHFNLHFEQI